MTTTSDRLAVVTPADWVPGSRQGQWTYNHYAALPDDGKRYEIVNGVLYMTPSPSIPHQRIAGRIYRYLCTWIGARGAYRCHVIAQHSRSTRCFRHIECWAGEGPGFIHCRCA